MTAQRIKHTLNTPIPDAARVVSRMKGHQRDAVLDIWNAAHDLDELARKLLAALETFVEHCPMCAAGIECQSDDCYQAREAIHLAKQGESLT